MRPRLPRFTLFVLAVTALSGVVGVHAQDADATQGVKDYLLSRVADQQEATTALEAAAQAYFDLASATDFDYAALRDASPDAVREALQAARAAWREASPAYESVEGIVAGVDLLSQFDVDLDAGLSAAEGPDDVVSFDLTLPDGRTLEKPGNLFGVTESTLWGTFDAFGSGVAFDVDGDGTLGFGDTLPDANVLLAASDLLDAMTAELARTGDAWQPTTADVFGALVGNVPTVAEVFIDRWRSSRFVLGDATTMRDFGVISSLQDLNDNISSWQELYAGVAPTVAAADAALADDIGAQLADLKAWAAGIAEAEVGHRYSVEEADLIYDEGDRRATAITGDIAQAAAMVGVTVE